LGKESLQWLVTFNGIGMIIGGVLAVSFARSVAPHKLLTLGMFVDSIGIAVSGISTTPWLTLTAQFCSGLVFPCISIGINTMILQNTEWKNTPIKELLHHCPMTNGFPSPPAGSPTLTTT